jgi:hypothetical protein
MSLLDENSGYPQQEPEIGPNEGKGTAEHPTFSQELSEGADQGYVVVPEPRPEIAFPAYSDEKSRNWKRIAMFSAPVLGIVLAAGALASSRGSEPKAGPIAESTPTPEPSIAPEPLEVVGNKTVLGIVEVNDSDIHVTRSNGMEILVPHLKASSPEEFADTFLTQFACYATTGAEACVNEVTDDPDVRRSFTSIRRQLDIATLQATSNLVNTQVEISGTPKFNSGKVANNIRDLNYIELDPSSELFLDVQAGGTDELNVWQGHNYTGKPDYKFEQLRVEYTVDDSNKVKVVGFKWVPVENA